MKENIDKEEGCPHFKSLDINWLISQFESEEFNVSFFFSVILILNNKIFFFRRQDQ